LPVPSAVAIHNDLGIAYHQDHQIKRAIDTLQRGIELDPLFPASHLNLGAVYDDFANYAAAAESYEEFIRLESTFGEAYSRLGIVYLKMNESDKAKAALQKAVELEPRNSEIWYNLGSLAFTSQDMSLAEQYLRTALEVNPLYSDAHYKLGQTLQRLGREDEAKQHFDEFKELAQYQEQIDGINRMLRQDSDRADVLYLLLGQTYSQMGRHQEALDSFTRSFEIEPKNGFALAGSAYALRALGRNDESLAAAEKAIELTPDHMPAYDMLMAAHAAKGDYDAAMAVVEKALALDPEYEFALVNRAVIHQKTGRYDNAIEELDRFVAAHADHLHAHETLLEIFTYASDETYRDAERALVEARLAESLGSKRFDLIGEAYHMSDDLARASEWLRRAISEDDGTNVAELQGHLDRIEAERATP